MADILEVEALSAGYGDARVLSDISFRLEAGKSLALLGRNGTGKTTLINTIMGCTRHMGGTLRLAGADITRARPESRAAAGLGWVPQERNIFRSLTVQENLTAVARPGPWTVERIYDLFPQVAQRRGSMGSQLSGGEQQMLALGRALVLNPKVILLDEPLEGLAPIIVDALLSALQLIARQEGLSMVVVEQKAQKILNFTDEALILDRGRIVHRGSSASLLADRGPLETHLGLVGRPA
jgi:branched-chain amino acid transport system ATP-binding protein